LDGNPFSNSHWPLKDEEAIDWCKKDFEAFIGQGEQAQGRSWRLIKESFFFGVCMGERKEERRMCVRKVFLVLMCGEVLMECVCRNQA